MTLPAQRSSRPSAYGIAPPILLAAVLVAVGVLFVQTWNGLDERRTFAERERQGVEYLRALNQVTMALVDVQTATIAGRDASRDALTRAVERTASVDARYGEELRTHERWAGVRAKIEALPEPRRSPIDDISATYSEAGGLILALYGKVRESSGLSRDPDADSYHLQDSVAEELPEALVAAGRLAGLATLATTRGSDDIRTAIDLSAARSAVLEPVEDLVDGLQAAVDSTESRDLSGNVLRNLDGYQRAIEALAEASTPTGTRGPNPAAVESARVAAQQAAAELAEVMLSELDGLLATRLDGLAGQRRLAAGTAAGALLLGLGLAYLLVVSGRRRAAHPAQPAEQKPPGPSATDPARDRDRNPGWTEPGPFGLGASGAPPAAAPVPAGAGSQGAPSAGQIELGRPATLAGLRGHLGNQTEPGPRSDRPAHWGRSDAAR